MQLISYEKSITMSFHRRHKHAFKQAEQKHEYQVTLGGQSKLHYPKKYFLSKLYFYVSNKHLCRIAKPS